MKKLIPILVLTLGCGHRIDDLIKLESFKVISKRDFKFCFNRPVDGYYQIVFITKSGVQVTKENVLAAPVDYTDRQCYTQSKMQHQGSAYNDEKKKFYEDSLIINNLKEIRWRISSDKHFKDVYAEGIFRFN